MSSNPSTARKKKRQARDGEKIFVNDICNKGIVFRIHKNSPNSVRHKTQIKTRQKISIYFIYFFPSLYV
jgi:hypothetical protein